MDTKKGASVDYLEASCEHFAEAMRPPRVGLAGLWVCRVLPTAANAAGAAVPPGVLPQGHRVLTLCRWFLPGVADDARQLNGAPLVA